MYTSQNLRWHLFVFHLTTLCVFITSITAAGREEVKGIVGESFTFNAQVFESGALLYEGLGNIAQVLNRQSNTDIKQKFKSRVHWDSQNGLFTLSDLKMEDSGLYTVENTKGENVPRVFHLTVYNKVLIPTVTAVQNSSIKLCSVVCSVENGRNVTLSWYKGKEILNQTSSPDLNTNLSLHLEIKDEFNNIYSCVADNPVSHQTTQLNITELCPHIPVVPVIPENRNRNFHTGLIIAVTVVFLLLVLGVTVCLKRRKQQHTQDPSATEELEADVVYTQINHSQSPLPQEPGNIRELVSGEENLQLTTVYDKIRPHPEASVNG